MTPKQLAKIRTRLKLSPTEMARAMNVPYMTYRNWEASRRKMSALAVRCVELLEMLPASKVKRLAAK